MNNRLKITSTLLLSAALLFPIDLLAQFTDTSGHKYEESILELAKSNVIEGYEDGSFNPEQDVSRAEMLKMTYATIAINPTEDAVNNSTASYNNLLSNCFSDVAEQWFATYVCQAKTAGVVQGYPDGSFKPGQAVSMVEAMKIVLEAFAVDFDEKNKNADWYTKYQSYFDQTGLLAKHTYFVERPATRAEIAYFVDQVNKIEQGLLNPDTIKTRSIYSEGCNNNFTTETPLTLQVNGQTRDIITYVPDSYNSSQAMSLIVAFHGRTNSNAQVQKYYGLEKATDGKAIIVYPAGLSNGSSFNWSDGGDKADSLRDYQLFDQILEEVNSRYCIDQEQIYAVGHSLGAWFTNSLACARGDVLRAVGTLGGSRATAQECSGPVSVMQFHNPNDNLAPYSTGLTALEGYIEQNSCSLDTVVVENPSWGNCVQYLGCSNDVTQLWCPHTRNYADYNGSYYPHNWPRETGQEIWDFFQGLDTA